MPLTVSFQLSDDDLAHFSERMNAARANAASLGEAAIVGSAQKLLQEVRGRAIPDFVRERMQKLGTLVQMVEDKSWNISGEDRTRIVDAIAYVADPMDLIPDHIPGIGLLDDAIMIELVCQDLGPDMEAYADFCKYRESELARRGPPLEDLNQEAWLTARRAQLHDRMARRRAKMWGSRLGRATPF
jgi:uncharacterized membrane protein YkvA (DUF1232 family)